MFGGDEVSAVVIDLGSFSCKAGYAGDDSPKAVFPSHFGRIEGGELTKEEEGDSEQRAKKQKTAASDSEPKEPKEDGLSSSAMQETIGSATNGKLTGGKRNLFVGSAALGFRRDDMAIYPTMRDGLIDNWDAVEAIWDHALRERLLIDPKEFAVLLSEPSFNPPKIRDKMVQMMFEKNGCPAVFLARNSVLASFACGKSTSLVVDSGGGSTTVAAVQDGYVLQKSLVRSPVGGDVISACLQAAVTSKGTEIRPRYSFKRREVQAGEFEVLNLDLPRTTDSYRQYCERLIVNDMKESVCRIPDAAFDETAYANVPTVPYELPDGQILEVGTDRFRTAEVLFNPKIVATIPGMEKWVEDNPLASLRSIPQMVVDSIGKCDADVRKELFSSVLLSGGSSVFPQFKERLEKELVEEAPQAAKVKVLASGNSIERKFSVWIGGSILASLGSFQQMWLSKSEYDEHGPNFIHRKCP